MRTPNGWSVAHTGGNCTALEKELRDGDRLIGRALITDDASVPVRATDPCILGIYDADDSGVLYFDCRNTREALRIVKAIAVAFGIGSR